MKKRILSTVGFVLLLAMLLSIGGVSYAASNFTTRSQFTGDTYTHYGTYADTKVKDMIDVSEHNGLINWYKVKSLGIDDAIIRIGYRGYGSAGTLVEDKYFYDNVDGALAAGINVGMYFYSQALNTDEAVAEANFALKRVKGYKPDLPIFFDYEFAEVSDGRLDYAWSSGRLNKTKMTNNVIAFCDTIKKAGYKAGIYSSSGFYTYQYNADSFLNRGYEFWNAYYTTNSTRGSYWPNYNHVYKYWQYGGDNVQGCCGAPSNAWLKVSYGSQTGYVSAQYIDFRSAAAGVCLTDGLRLRKGAGTGYGIITTLDRGDKVTIHSYPTNTNTDLNFYYAKPSIAAPSFKLTATKTSATVTWSKVSGAAFYRVYSYDTSTGKYERLAQSTGTSFTQTGLSAGTKYTYLVRAFKNSSTGSDYSTSDNKSVVTVTEKPTLELDRATTTTLSFTWKAVKGASYYRLYSYDSATKSYERLAQVDTTYCKLTGFSKLTQNHILIRAFNASNLGSEYTEQDVQTFGTGPIAPKLTLSAYSYSVKLNWNAVPQAKYYKVFLYDSATKQYTKLAQTTGTAWEHGYIKANRQYTYLVRAYLSERCGSDYGTKNLVSIKTLLAKPKFTLSALDEHSIKVSWGTISGASFYRVYLYDTQTGKYARIAQTKNTSFTYTGAQSGTKYTFLVRSFNANTVGSSYSAANHQSIMTPQGDIALS